jgi:hypothetical protein
LADEAAARPETIRDALRRILQCGRFLQGEEGFLQTLAQGRYGADLREEARRSAMSLTPDLANSAIPLAYAVWWQTVEAEDAAECKRAGGRFVELLASPERISKVEGALWLDVSLLRPC